MNMIDILIDIAQEIFQYPIEADTPIKSIPGSSLQLMHFKTQIDAKAACNIPLEQLYQVSTLRQLAELLPQFAVTVTSGDI